MAKLTILGTCSGTEPIQGRNHTSIALEAGESVYFLDAGEGCARSAHLAGIDLLMTRAIFLSHTHFDHIGGLAGLFWHTRKLTSRRKENVCGGDIRLFIPQLESWEAVHQLLSYTESGFKCKFTITPDLPKLGKFYEDENLTVTGFPSYHLPDSDGLCRSFSYRLDFPDYRLVFSGDIGEGRFDALMPVIGDGCDLLLMETGHHNVADVCHFAEENNIGELVLIHHGRDILNNEPYVQETVSTCKIKTAIAFDGMQITWKDR